MKTDAMGTPSTADTATTLVASIYRGRQTAPRHLQHRQAATRKRMMRLPTFSPRLHGRPEKGAPHHRRAAVVPRHHGRPRGSTATT
jgi:hypothetical protein